MSDWKTEDLFGSTTACTRDRRAMSAELCLSNAAIALKRLFCIFQVCSSETKVISPSIRMETISETRCRGLQSIDVKLGDLYRLDGTSITSRLGTRSRKAFRLFITIASCISKNCSLHNLSRVRKHLPSIPSSIYRSNFARVVAKISDTRTFKPERAIPMIPSQHHPR